MRSRRSTTDGLGPPSTEICYTTPITRCSSTSTKLVGGSASLERKFRAVSLLSLVRVRFGLALMHFHYKFLFKVAYCSRLNQLLFASLLGWSPALFDDQSRSGRVIQVPSYEGEG